MKIKKGLSLCMMFAVLLFPLYLMADTAGDTAGEISQDDPADNGDQTTTGSTEEPTYTNPAQAMHAAQLAESASLQPNEATREAAKTLENAREAYDKAYRESLADPETPAVAEALTLAEQDLEQARKAYAERIGELAGVLGEEIQAMRQERMGWGQIAHELGVHPGALGLGHTKHKGVLDPVDPVDAAIDDPAAATDPAAEIAEATKRDPKTGWNRDHGLAVSTASSSKKGLGLSETSAAVAGKSPGNAAGNGKGSSSKSSGGQSASSASKSNSSASQAGSSRGADGSPGNSSQSSNSGKDKNDKSDKGDKSNNGNGKGNSKK